MNVTELLVTGYNGEKPVFVVNLSADAATTVLTGDDNGREATVNATGQHATFAFTHIRELLDGLTLAAR